MARRKSLAGSNTSRARIPLPVHGVDIRAQQSMQSMQGGGHTVRRRLWRPSETALGATSSMCRRRHVRICTCVGDASPTPCMWYMSRQRARRTFALITFLSVTDIYTYIHRRPCCTISCLASRSAISHLSLVPRLPVPLDRECPVVQGK